MPERYLVNFYEFRNRPTTDDAEVVSSRRSMLNGPRRAEALRCRACVSAA